LEKTKGIPTLVDYVEIAAEPKFPNILTKAIFLGEKTNIYFDSLSFFCSTIRFVTFTFSSANSCSTQVSNFCSGFSSAFLSFSLTKSLILLIAKRARVYLLELPVFFNNSSIEYLAS